MPIDYGRHTHVNRNPKTGIHFGCITLNALNPDLADELFALPNPALAAAFADYARDQLQDFADKGTLTAADLALDSTITDLSEAIAALPDQGAIDLLEALDLRAPDDFWTSCDSTLNGATGTLEGITVSIFELGGALHLLVLDSPHTGHYAFCSPCVPGAGDLNSPDPAGPRTYDVPPDWRATEVH